MASTQEITQSVKQINEWLSKEFGTIRTGRATPQMLDDIRVEAYGNQVKINEVASISLEDPKTLRIAPWDSSNIKAIEKAIMISNTGVSVSSDEKGVRVSFPPLTTESRTQFVKVAKQKLEEAKVRLRQDRNKIIDVLEKKKKEGVMSEDQMMREKNEVEKTIKEANESFDNHYKKKEAEILGG